MLFSPEPKTRRQDYFDYEEELARFTGWLKDDLTKLVIIRGLRRTGKTSFVNVGLADSGQKYIRLDARSLTGLSRVEFEKRLLEAFKEVAWLPEKILKRLSSIEYAAKFSFRSADSLWAYLTSQRAIIFIDEAQALKGSGSDALLASIYDSTKCKLVLSGSEIGMLNDFIGTENPAAPLFGRAAQTIDMHPLAREKSLEFLSKGFAQAKKNIKKEELEYAVDRLDGVIGWLTYFGFTALQEQPQAALEKTLAAGTAMMKKEFAAFVATRPGARKRYEFAMEAVCSGNRTWTTVKTYLSAQQGYAISDHQLANFLSTLVAYSFLTKANEEYFPADPIIQQAWKKKD